MDRNSYLKNFIILINLLHCKKIYFLFVRKIWTFLLLAEKNSLFKCMKVFEHFKNKCVKSYHVNIPHGKFTHMQVCKQLHTGIFYNKITHLKNVKKINKKEFFQASLTMILALLHRLQAESENVCQVKSYSKAIALVIVFRVKCTFTPWQYSYFLSAPIDRCTTKLNKQHLIDNSWSLASGIE